MKLAIRWRSAALSALFGTLALLLVLGVLGRPSVFSDTKEYLTNGRALASSLHLAPPLPVEPPFTGPLITSHHFRVNPALMGARTPAYGLPMWLLTRLGGLWLLATVQAAIGAWLIWLAWRTLAPGTPVWTAYVVQAATAALSPLPFVAGFAMPDVFCGYLVLSMILLLVAWACLARWERVALVALAVYSMTLHGSHLPLGMALACAGVVGVILRPESRRAATPTISAVLGAVLLAIMAAWGIKALQVATVHDEAGRPPFLSARLLADGPGRTYLRSVCGHGESYTLCRFRYMPLDDSEKLLWSTEPSESVFALTDFQTRMRLWHEDTRFASNVFMFDPLGVITSAIGNMGDQLSKAWVDDQIRDQNRFIRRVAYARGDLPELVRSAGRCPDYTRCLTVMDSIASAAFHSLWLFAAGSVIAWLLYSDRKLPPSPWTLAVLLLGIALVINAAVCGALSVPMPRYGARLAWLLVTMAVIGGVRVWARRRPELRLAAFEAP